MSTLCRYIFTWLSHAVFLCTLFTQCKQKANRGSENFAELRSDIEAENYTLKVTGLNFE